MNGEHSNAPSLPTTERRLPPEFKAKWLEALRSGKYTQGKNSLRTEAGLFCCMGVACDIIDPAKWAQESHGDGYDWGHARAGYTDNALGQALGISKSEMGTLASMNDEAGKSFAEIADYIEANL